jgi:hypothetical protein
MPDSDGWLPLRPAQHGFLTQVREFCGSLEFELIEFLFLITLGPAFEAPFAKDVVRDLSASGKIRLTAPSRLVMLSSGTKRSEEVC